MKAARLHAPRKPLVVESIEEPKPSQGDVLLKVGACGLCHTDLHFLDGVNMPSKLPFTLGHEIAGEIVEAGDAVKEFKVRERVAVSMYATCGSCHYCLTGWDPFCTNMQAQIGFTVDGGYAEFVRVPEQALVHLPADVGYVEGGIATDGMASAFHAVTAIAKVRMGEAVVINGTGGLGSYALQVARLSGARVVAIDIFEEKLELAKRLGADAVVNAAKASVPEEVRRLTEGGADVVMEFVSTAKAIQTSLECLRSMGRLVLVGYSKDSLTVSPKVLVAKGVQILGSRGNSKHELVQVLDLIRKKRIEPNVSCTFPLDKINEALDLLARGSIVGRSAIIP